MRNQLDLIVSISFIVFAGIIAVVLYATRHEGVKQSPPPQVVNTALTLPAADVKYSNSLPAGGGGGGGGRGGNMFAGGGGPMMPGGGGRKNVGSKFQSAGG